MEKNKIYLIDSNIFVGAFCKEDSLNEDSIHILEKIKNSKIIVPYCIVQEVCSIFAYRFGKEKADNFIKFLLETENIELINNEIFDEIDFYL